MADQIDRLCHPPWLESRAGRSNFHKTYLAQIFGPPEICPDGYPGRPMASPSAILERCWFQNTPKMEPKSGRILTSAKLWFLLPLPCEINVFTAQDPSQNDTKSLQKETLQLDPPKILNFQLQGASGWQHEPKRLPKGFLLGGPGTPKTVPKGTQSAVENRLLKTDRVFSSNGCQSGFPKRFKLAQILSKEISRNVLIESNSGK